MTSYSEDQVKAALARIDGLLVYKPPDDARNWRPADFLIWWDGNVLKGAPKIPRAGMLEVKQNDRKLIWHWTGGGAESLRPSQLAAVAKCNALGMPYFVAVYWKSRRYWTLHRIDQWLGIGIPYVDTPLRWEDAITRYGVGAAPVNLADTLAGLIHGDTGL